MKIKVDVGSWKPKRIPTKAVKEGVAKMCQSLAEAYLKDLNNSNGLPKDWRNRIIKSGGNQ